MGGHASCLARTHLLGEAVEELLHVGGQVLVEAAEGPQHVPDHLQGQTVEPGKLVEEQRVEGPGRGGGVRGDHLCCGVSVQRRAFHL